MNITMMCACGATFTGDERVGYTTALEFWRAAHAKCAERTPARSTEKPFGFVILDRDECVASTELWLRDEVAGKEAVLLDASTASRHNAPHSVHALYLHPSHPSAPSSPEKE